MSAGYEIDFESHCTLNWEILSILGQEKEHRGRRWGRRPDLSCLRISKCKNQEHRGGSYLDIQLVE